MTDFKRGDLVDITIKGARVGIKGVDSDPRRLYVDLGPWDDGVNKGGEWGMTFPTTVEGVTVKRVAPAEWPPRPGDLWRDKHNALWFARVAHPEGGLRMVTADGLRWSDGHEGQLVDNGPWALVYREAGDRSAVAA
jgi:hypothetical protein